VNILFNAAGRRVSLLRHFRKVLDELHVEGEIIAADLDYSAPAFYVADRKLIIPRCSSPDYIQTLLDYCDKFSVGLLTSLIDTDLVLLAKHKAQFEAVGTKLLLCSEASNKICADKQETAKFFIDNDIPCPRVFSIQEARTLSAVEYPILIKPYDGSSGVGVTKINTPDELEFFFNYLKNPMIQEFIEGEEYTIDVYVDFGGNIRCAVPRKRLQVRGGEVSKGVAVKDEQIMKAACDVVAALPGATGCVNVQCIKQSDGQLKFIEINPRFGGGFPLSIHAGADFPRWIIQDLINGSSDAKMSDWMDGTVMLRFDDEIVVSQKDIS